VIPRPGTRRPPRRHLRLTTRGRSPPRTAVGARVVPPVDGPATASPDDRHDRLLDASLLPSQPLTVEVLRRPVESALAAVIGVVHQARRGVALADGHVQGVQDQFGAQMVGHRPAHDPAGEAVQHHRQVQPALVGALLGDVGHPQPVRPWRREVPLHQVRRWCSGRVAACRPVPSTAVDALQAVVTHQPGDPFAADVDIQAQPELGVYAWRAIGAPAAGMDLADLFAEIGVLQRPLRRRARRPGVVAGACHTQHAAQSGDLVVCFLRVDQPVAAHR
jgi:hypothetical protein